jgi:hypothetical protein
MLTPFIRCASELCRYASPYKNQAIDILFFFFFLQIDLRVHIKNTRNSVLVYR